MKSNHQDTKAQKHKENSSFLPLCLCAFVLAFALLFGVGGGRAAPVAPPLAGILLAVDTPEQDRIVLYDPLTDVSRTLDFGGAEQRVWGFSPDGCRLIVTMGAEDEARLYDARLDGSDRRALIIYTPTPPLNARAMWSAWEANVSPTDGRIAFMLTTTTITPNGDRALDSRIAWVNADGGDPVPVSVTGREYTPRWSPDGRWLAYVSYDEAAGGGLAPPSRAADLWMASPDGATRIRLTNFERGSVAWPRWSPAADLVGFIYAASPNADQIWMIGASDNAIPTPLTVGEALALDMAWFPDGTAIAATLMNFEGIAENRLWRIPLITSEGVSEIAAAGALRYLTHVRYSPDGRWLSLRAAYTLTLIDQQTGAVSQPAAIPPGNTAPVWSTTACAQ